MGLSRLPFMLTKPRPAPEGYSPQVPRKTNTHRDGDGRCAWSARPKRIATHFYSIIPRCEVLTSLVEPCYYFKFK